MLQGAMLRFASLIAFISFVSQPTTGRQTPPKPVSGSAQRSARPSTEAPSSPNRLARTPEQRRLENLIKVHGFADSIQEFKNLTARVRGLVGLADVLWKEDEPHARKLFASAYEAAGDNVQAPEADNPGGPDAGSQAPDFGWLRREVLAGIARHDLAWAKSLTAKEADASKSGRIYFEMAAALVSDDPKEARQYIEMGLNSDANQDIGYVLDALRRKDPAAADSLFIKSLQGLAAQPRVPANELILFSFYVMAPDIAVPFLEVGRHSIFNISGVNPSASPLSIRAYLGAAVDILSRPVTSSPNEVFAKEENYIGACILLSSVRQFTPERAPQLEAVMRDLAPDISNDLTEDAVRARIKAARPGSVTTLEEAQTELGGIPDDARHDSCGIALAHAFFLKNDFLGAKAIAGEVKDLQTRDKLMALLGFEEGAMLVDRGKLNEAMSIATKLSPGIERAILWLGIAHKQIERGDTKPAGTTMNWALADANRIQDPRRAVLILRAAADLAPFDRVLASQAMNQAVRTFDRVSPYSPLKMEWSESVGAHPSYLTFPLQVGGLGFQFGRMLGPLAKIDMDGTIYEVMSLEDEEARGQSLAALASFILEKKAAN